MPLGEYEGTATVEVRGSTLDRMRELATADLVAVLGTDDIRVEQTGPATPENVVINGAGVQVVSSWECTFLGVRR